MYCASIKHLFPGTIFIAYDLKKHFTCIKSKFITVNYDVDEGSQTRYTGHVFCFGSCA